MWSNTGLGMIAYRAVEKDGYILKDREEERVICRHTLNCSMLSTSTATLDLLL